MPADKQSDTVNTRYGDLLYRVVYVCCRPWPWPNKDQMSIRKGAGWRAKCGQKLRQTAAKYKQRFLNVVIKMK